MSNNLFPSQFNNDMRKLQSAYLNRIQGSVEEIVNIEKIITLNLIPPALEIVKLRRIAHNFSGSGTSFGFPHISETARKLQQTLERLASRNDDGQCINELRQNVQLLISTLKDASGVNLETATEALVKTAPPAPELKFDTGTDEVYIYSFKLNDYAGLESQLKYFGYHASVSNRFEEIKEICAAGYMKALIIVTDLLPTDIPLIKEITDLKAETVPLIIVSSYEDFEARLTAAKLGADAYFTMPIDPLVMIEKIEKLSSKFASKPPFNVLIVDDDENLAELYAQTLRHAGMTASILIDPEKILKHLAENETDLLLMDFSMPGFNGQELATVIRQYEQYISMPIVFISSRQDIESILLNKGLGIEDFIVKPFMPAQLLSVVSSRAQRANELRALMIRDAFTGLINHARFNEELDMELMRIKRTRQDNSFYAMVDIDHFKNINDTFGHDVGDQVIKSLARLLKQHLRRTDVIGRCGGEEFGVIMPGCNAEQAAGVVEKLRTKFSDSFLTVGEHKIRVTLSGGVTQITHISTIDGLIKEADEALYVAKKGGRNKIVMAKK